MEELLKTCTHVMGPFTDLILVVNKNVMRIAVHRIIMMENSEHLHNTFIECSDIGLEMDVPTSDSAIFLDLVNKIYGKDTNTASYPELKHLIELKKACRLYGVENKLDLEFERLAHLFDTVELVNTFLTFVDDIRIKIKFMLNNLSYLKHFNENLLCRLYEELMSYKIIFESDNDLYIYNIKTVVDVKKKVTRTLNLEYIYKHKLQWGRKSSGISDILMSPNQQYLALIAMNTVNIFDLEKYQFIDSATDIKFLSFTSDSTAILFTDKYENGYRDIQKKQISSQETLTVTSHVEPVDSIVLSSMDTFLAAPYKKGIIIYDGLSSSKKIKEIANRDNIKIMFTPDEEYIIVVDEDRDYKIIINIYDTKTWSHVYCYITNFECYLVQNWLFGNDVLYIGVHKYTESSSINYNAIINIFFRLDSEVGWHKCEPDFPFDTAIPPDDANVIDAREIDNCRDIFVSSPDIFSFGFDGKGIKFSQYSAAKKKIINMQQIKIGIENDNSINFAFPQKSIEQQNAILELERMLGI